MKTEEARQLGDRLSELVGFQHYQEADNLLSPLLSTRTTFRLLDLIGERLGKAPLDNVDIYLDQIATRHSMGGWVVIASALRRRVTGKQP